MKQFLITILSIATILSITSCRANESSFSTTTPELIELPTPMSTEKAIPSVTPLCFMPIDLTPISFTPDNKMLAIRTNSGVQIFNLEKIKEEDFLQAPQNIVSAALSPNGQILAWSFEDHAIQLIQVSDGRLLKTIKGHTDIVFKLRFSPNSDRLFSASHDGTVRVWDSKGDPLEVIETGSEVLGIGVSSDGTRLATIPFDGPVELWDLISYKKLSALGGTGGFDTSDAVFSPDGEYLAADLATGLFLWRISDGKSLWDKAINGMAITFSPDGRFLAYSITDDRNKVILSSPNGTQTIRSLTGMQGPVWELIFSPDSSLLAATDGIEIRIWQVDDGKLLYIGKSSCN